MRLQRKKTLRVRKEMRPRKGKEGRKQTGGERAIRAGESEKNLMQPEGRPHEVALQQRGGYSIARSS